jgi:4-aminobutyrate aminotransferase-like enzyme
MTSSICLPGEDGSNRERASLVRVEPKALRTFTPTQAVLARSSGIFHWTADGKRLVDFTSGVLVSNLGHNPTGWFQHFFRYMNWSDGGPAANPKVRSDPTPGFLPALPLTAYNAVTSIEVESSRRLIDLLGGTRGGKRLEQVMWAASGSEAIQKAIWASMARDRTRPIILATRFGFHGKKGLANAVTGSESDAERDPRVRFIGFPMSECRDVSLRNEPFDPAPYRAELDSLLHQFGRKIGTLITEPYLGGGGSYHPPAAYLQLLDRFCRENDVVFILDEVQANFGRTGRMFAFETYGIEPDIVVLGKGLGNGVPVAAAVGRRDVFAALDYGEGSDTWSANPLAAAAVLATLDEFAARDVIGTMKPASAAIEAGLVGLKEFPFVANVRGERGGMVWGVEMRDFGSKSAAEWANEFVLACYLADGQTSDGVHLLGPLSKKVVRVAPPLVITEAEAVAAIAILHRSAAGMVQRAGLGRTA